jgi:AcrR family transcriptional regulator
MAARKSRPTDVKEACIEEALRIIDTAGVEQLSLREVARRLGVSHQAPYKHFPSRDHLLAEIVTRAYRSFADYLDRRPLTGDPAQDLGSMGIAYLDYARLHPLQYRLMFGTPLPEPGEHPAMLEHARHAYAVLLAALRVLPSASGGPRSARQVDHDAMFIWATLHGLASILQSDALRTLELAPERMQEFASETLVRIGAGIAVESQKLPRG